MSVSGKYRKKLSKCTLVLLAVLLNVSSHAVAITQLDKHVHGESELTIAFENQELAIELLSPAINIVGFEHKAKTDEEIAAISKAMVLLSHHNEMFTFSNGDCELINYFVDVSSVSNPIAEERNHTTSKHAEHSHKTNNEQIRNHSEVIAHYAFRCKKASTPPDITVKVFELFTGINHITAIWLTQTQQGSVILNPSNNIINFRE